MILKLLTGLNLIRPPKKIDIWCPLFIGAKLSTVTRMREIEFFTPVMQIFCATIGWTWQNVNCWQLLAYLSFSSLTNKLSNDYIIKAGNCLELETLHIAISLFRKDIIDSSITDYHVARGFKTFIYSFRLRAKEFLSVFNIMKTACIIF